ncbi:helix-turn-helix domain-containing protein [Nocardia macrotermitis]|uniref:HTH cro/C1-type domain-containing protein n=1 Tax=Nocardia macrotermitis TaxID=2585198 RepID=A0A7K0DF58_9NOCA|nr:helix-turn-helix transcriptional regulator [Nocardia macrotermitis]MQY24337.1 hypothetical protein [Nocardia macrotermitis]
MTVSSPVADWELRLRIREQAERHGLKGGQMAKALGITPQYWSSLTGGKVLFTSELLEKTLDVLEFGPDDRHELLALRENAKGRAPFANYSALFDESFMRLYGLEQGAQAIRTFETSVVPGLLQTEDYIRAIMRSTAATRPAEAEQRVRARLERQRRLDPPAPLQLSAVISQAVLMSRVGGPQVHQKQLLHLRDIATDRSDTIDLRVIPFESGDSLAGLNTATFHLIDFPSARLPTVGWLETAIHGELTEDARKVDAMQYLYDQVRAIALSPEDSLQLIDRIAKQTGQS